MAPVRAGVLGSVVVLAGAVGTAGGAVLADRAARRDVRRRLVVPAAAGVASSALLGTAFLAVPAGSAQLLLILAGGATVTAAVGPAAAAVLDVVQPGLRATAISVFVLVQNLFGLAIGPVLAGAIADRWGLTSALGAVAGLGVPAALALYCSRAVNPAASSPIRRLASRTPLVGPAAGRRVGDLAALDATVPNRCYHSEALWSVSRLFGDPPRHSLPTPMNHHRAREPAVSGMRSEITTVGQLVSLPSTR